MTCLTFNYKKHYIHVRSSPKCELIEVQIVDNLDDSFSTATIHQVKSVQAAKLLITKHVKANK